MRRGFTSILILACFGALFLIVYAPALFHDRQFGFRDAGHYYYPLNKRVQAEWNRGRWPLWEPEENAGMPLLGNPTAAVLYPGKLVFAILPYAWGARMYVVGHSALGVLEHARLDALMGHELDRLGSQRLGLRVWRSVLFQYCNIIYLIGAAWLPLGRARGRSMGSARAAVGPPGTGRRLVDADVGRRPPGGVSPGTGEHRLCAGHGLESCTTKNEAPGSKRTGARGSG